MSRAEWRRQKAAEQKIIKKMEKAVQKAGVDTKSNMPPAPLRIFNLSTEKVAELTGTDVAVLDQWRKEQVEKIQKELIIEAQEKLDKAENYITLCTIMTTMKALEGFRYAKSAARHIIKNYEDSVQYTTKEKVRETYNDLHERWGIEFEFDEPDLDSEMGFDTYDWRYEYIGMHVPPSVYGKIWDDSKELMKAVMTMAMLWELCEDFGFHKKKFQMLNKFKAGLQKKYDAITERSFEQIEKMILEKYGLGINWEKDTISALKGFGIKA